MTVHSAKGLEFKNVFVVGLEENLFPSGMAGDSPRALEEERRLFYVAITRAEEHCFLSFSKTRFRYGKMEFGTPSRFLRDIDTRYLKLSFVDSGSRQPERLHHREQVAGSELPRKLKKVTAALADRSPASQAPVAMHGLQAAGMEQGTSGMEEARATMYGLRAGQRIEHERFGSGDVLKVEGSGDNAKATIRFENVGEKQLLLRFARFKVIE